MSDGSIVLPGVGGPVSGCRSNIDEGDSIAVANWAYPPTAKLEPANATDLHMLRTRSSMGRLSALDRREPNPSRQRGEAAD
jgi:hypothetical protein